ncbi:MAG TPA: hypothetical protein VJI69_03285 [Bacteroidia bacterium]|nr:hypothetical protein [Bacteroidia bacterium]
MKNKNYSLYSLLLIFPFILAIFFSFNIWNKNRIIVDAPSYYTYLPALIIHNDLKLNYIDSKPAYYKNKVWYYKIENDKKLIKHPMGISIALSPFFVAGHLIAKMNGAVQDGYSMTYQNAVSVGVLFYLFIGLYFLRKILLDYFSEKITAITLIAIVLGTNLLWYSSFEGLMPHAITFSVWCLAMYTFFQWLKTAERKFLLYFSALLGLIVLIRPLSIVAILYFIIIGIYSKGGLKLFFDFVRINLKPVIIGVVIAFIIASLQLMYWKYATGKWLYDVYMDEHFVFSSPQILPFLFSFRKGVFIYTPILIFALFGLQTFYKTNKGIFWSTVILMCITIFLLSSWWAWSYGICWGMRPMIDYYALLSLPLAAGFQLVFSKSKAKQLFFAGILFFLISLNLFQTWQYKNGLIHYDDMSKEAYFKGFFQTKSSIEWADLLKPYDWERRENHLPQIEYSAEFLKSNKKEIYLRGTNLMYVVVNEKAQNAMGALGKDYSANSIFYIKHHEGNTISIHSSVGLYWSMKPQYENAITASETNISSTEKFTFEYLADDDNRIALKAANGKYISIGSKWPFILKADSDKIGKNETFRYFVIGK